MITKRSYYKLRNISDSISHSQKKGLQILLACLLLEFNNKLFCTTAGQFVLVVHGMQSCSEFSCKVHKLYEICLCREDFFSKINSNLENKNQIL